MRLAPRILIAVFSIFSFIATHAEDMVLAGYHPTSPNTPFPPIHTLKAFGGRIYAGHGDWNYYPAVCIASYDPVSGAWHTEHSPGTDSIGMFRPIRSSLYAPSIDPVHFDEFTDYSVLSAGIWRRHAPAGFLHVFDFATVAGNDVWMVGSKSRSETANQNAAVWRSLDDGITWSEVTLTNSQGRYYYCFTLRGRLYVHDTIYDGTNATRMAVSPYPFFYKPITVPAAADELVLGLTQQTPGIGGFNRTALASFDGTNWLVVKTNVLDLAAVGTTIYTLDYNPASQLNEIQVADLSASAISWATLPLSNVPAGAKAIEVLDGIVYVGDTNGGLWLGRIDGSTMTVPPVTTVHDLPEGFGRAIAVSETVLAIGSPEATGAAIMSGQVTVWTRSSRVSQWSEPQVITSLEPSYSGWFGKDVAVANGLLSVLEAGIDTSGRDRGTSSKTHLYEHDGTAWQFRQTVTNTYVHSIALTSNTLWVAASTVLHRYAINRTPDGASMSLAESFASGKPSAMYEPAARVAATETRVAFSSVGDPSRDGGPGQVNVLERDASKWRQIAVLRQTNSPLPAGLNYQPDAFGFAVAMAGDWLAVGAPRDDAAAWQAGAVHLYQRVVAGTNINFVPRQKIISPVPQQDGWFGSSLAFEGDYLIIGQPGFHSPTRRRDGRVYFYRLADTNALRVAEIAAPPNSETEFGVEVALDGDVIMAGSRATAPHSDPWARVFASTILEITGEPSDLALAGTVEPLQAMAGTLVTHTVILSNAGPSAAAFVSVAISPPTNGTVSSVTASVGACTADAGAITCSLPNLDSGSAVTIQITIEPTFSDFCSVMRSRVTVSATEFDPDLRNNELSLAVNDFIPTISLLSPLDGTTVRVGTPVQLSAEAFAGSGVTHVHFYRSNSVLIGSAISPPYTYTWTQAPPGVHTITALLLDQCGISRTSAPVTLVVTSNALPLISMTSPLDRTRYMDANDIRVAVEASDPDGSIALVRVFSGTTLLRTFTGPPYMFSWTNAPLGTMILRAVATDNDGATNTSARAIITVGAPPAGSTWVAYNDHESGPATHPNATRYNIRSSGSGASGRLKDVVTGATVPASLSLQSTTLQNISSSAAAPAAGTPADQAFTGYIDYTFGTNANVPVTSNQLVLYFFTGLNVTYRYNLQITAIAGNDFYTDRWSRLSLSGAQSFRAQHSSGTLTQGTGGLLSNEVAINTGFNIAGDVAHWNDIEPGPGGTITVQTRQYIGPIPIGSGTGSTAPYGYAPTMVRLEQKNITMPTVSTSAVSRTVSPGATVTFTASGSGADPLTYQWYRDGMPIDGATSPTLTLVNVGSSDVARYNIRVSSPDGHAFGKSALLSLFSIRPNLDLELVGPIAQRYQVQQRATFDPMEWPFDPEWTTLTNITVQSVPALFRDPEATNSPQQFYRATPAQ